MNHIKGKELAERGERVIGSSNRACAVTERTLFPTHLFFFGFGCVFERYFLTRKTRGLTTYVPKRYRLVTITNLALCTHTHTPTPQSQTRQMLQQSKSQGSVNGKSTQRTHRVTRLLFSPVFYVFICVYTLRRESLGNYNDSCSTLGRRQVVRGEEKYWAEKPSKASFSFLLISFNRLRLLLPSVQRDSAVASNRRQQQQPPPNISVV